MEGELKKKIRKPNSVFMMCFVLFLNFGLYQLYFDIRDMRQNDVETPLIIAVLLISLDVFSAATVIWTFFGDNLARILMLICITLNMLWTIFIFILFVASAVPKENGYYDSNILFFAIHYIKPLIIFILCWWYFTQSEIIAYYKQENNYEFF